MRVRVLGIDADRVRADLERQGVTEGAPDHVRDHLESVWRAVVSGYNASLADPRPGELARVLLDVPLSHRGWAYEGVGIGLTVLDTLLPPKRRVKVLLHGSGVAHGCLIAVGIGWGFAQLHRLPRRPPYWLDPIYGWMVYDGAGFRAALFNPERAVVQGRLPWTRHTAPVTRIIDHGVGRSLWFIEGADPERIRARIEALPATRHQDLWSGVALGATYAGGISVDQLAILREAAGEHANGLKASAAIAARARALGANLTDWTDQACLVFCGVSAREAAQATELALEGLSPGDRTSPYLAWRDRIPALLS